MSFYGDMRKIPLSDNGANKMAAILTRGWNWRGPISKNFNNDQRDECTKFHACTPKCPFFSHIAWTRYQSHCSGYNVLQIEHWLDLKLTKHTPYLHKKTSYGITGTTYEDNGSSNDCNVTFCLTISAGWQQSKHQSSGLLAHGPVTRYVKLRVPHAPEMPGTFSATDCKGAAS